ncbi:MAG TPA: c-type cytochrome [Gammaproteobacteria bacterium]
MSIALLLLFLLVATLLFHFLSPWYLTPLASNWGLIDTTIDITLIVTGIVFVAVNLFMAYCVLKFRHKPGLKAEYDPENTKLEVWLTVVTSVGVVAMLAPGLVVWGQFVTVPDDATDVEGVGQQWHWSYRLPGEDGQLGNVDIRHITERNPFGLDPEDPTGQDDVLVANPVLHLPVDRPVRMLLRSKDVLHNFTVPQFRVKMDLVPGMVTYEWFTPTVVGQYDVLCEELCGIAHFAMRGRVVVDTQEDYDEWLAEQPTFADTMARPAGDATAGRAAYAICAACHGQNGEGNQALNAPKIAGQEGWYLRRQIQYFKNGVRGTTEGDIFGATMAPIMAAVPDDTAIDNIVAYIETLPSEPATQTVTGDPANGERLYRSCAACHGYAGEGIWALNAPGLAGMSDWYLARQLQYFQDEIRGAHPQDAYGHQMLMLADVLPDEQAINDMIAYINTL